MRIPRPQTNGNGAGQPKDRCDIAAVEIGTNAETALLPPVGALAERVVGEGGTRGVRGGFGTVGSE